jgi:hypothetical protein
MFYKIPLENNKARWIAVAVIIKLLIFFTISLLGNYDTIINKHQLWSVGGDFHDYIDPVENFLKEGKFYFGENNFAGRMPGYTIIYFPVRLLFNYNWALNVTLILQVIISGISVFYLAQIFYKWTNNITLSYFVFFIYALADYVSAFDRAILTESLAVSCLIFLTYHLINYFKGINRDTKTLFYAGIFLTWAIFLRPFYIPYILCIPFLIILIQQLNLKNKIITIIIFLLPFIVAESAWIIRNYAASSRLIFLQSTFYKGNMPDPTERSFRKFIESFGGDYAAWNPTSEAIWFRTDEYIESLGFVRPNDNIFPKEIFSEKFTLDTLYKARQLLQQYELDKINKIHVDDSTNEVNMIFSSFLDTYKQERPIYYNIIAPLRITKRFIFHPYTYNVPFVFSEANFLGKAIKLFNFAISAFVIIGGVISLVLLSFHTIRKFNLTDVLIFSYPYFIWVIVCLIFRSSQYRFMVFAYPFLLIILFKFIHIISLKTNKKQVS